MKIYKCDGCNTNGENCFNTDTRTDSWITIGSESSDLFIENNLSERRLISIGRHSDLHFCSKSCFINKFFFNDKQ